MFEINFVNRENKFKIKTGYKQRLTLYNRTNHVNVKYHKPPVWNCHSEDKHSISIGILIPSATKYINMCSILFIVPFYLII